MNRPSKRKSDDGGNGASRRKAARRQPPNKEESRPIPILPPFDAGEAEQESASFQQPTAARKALAAAAELMCEADAPHATLVHRLAMRVHELSTACNGLDVGALKPRVADDPLLKFAVDVFEGARDGAPVDWVEASLQRAIACRDDVVLGVRTQLASEVADQLEAVVRDDGECGSVQAVAFSMSVAYSSLRSLIAVALSSRVATGTNEEVLEELSVSAREDLVRLRVDWWVAAHSADYADRKIAAVREPIRAFSRVHPSWHAAVMAAADELWNEFRWSHAEFLTADPESLENARCQLDSFVDIADAAPHLHKESFALVERPGGSTEHLDRDSSAVGQDTDPWAPYVGRGATKAQFRQLIGTTARSSADTELEKRRGQWSLAVRRTLSSLHMCSKPGEHGLYDVL